MKFLEYYNPTLRLMVSWYAEKARFDDSKLHYGANTSVFVPLWECYKLSLVITIAIISALPTALTAYGIDIFMNWWNKL